jgi:hypothetical protein
MRRRAADDPGSPICTCLLANVSDIGEACGAFPTMRQLGGEFGVAIRGVGLHRCPHRSSCLHPTTALTVLQALGQPLAGLRFPAV